MSKFTKYIAGGWERLVSSLDNHSLGMSGRKLAALTAMAFAFYVHYLLRKMVMTGKNEEAILDTLFWFDIVDLLFVLLCLGIVTFEQIIKLKMDKGNDKVKENEKSSEQLPS